MEEYYYDYIVLGGGLAGLSFTANLKSDSIRVIEKSDEPGGLIKSIKINDFWFDSVVHLLHFQNDKDKELLKKYISPEFAPLIQNANVVTNSGKTTFPFQLNLGELPKETAVKCVTNFIEKAYSKPTEIKNFKEWLLQSFGEEMCQVFFYPYNKKMWKYPLESLATRDFTWTIQQFNLDKVIGGLITEIKNNESYNLNSLYPIPEETSYKRCMGILTDNIYNDIKEKVQLDEEIIEINSDEKYVISEQKNGNFKKYYFAKACISTIALPELQKRIIPKQEKIYQFKSTGVIYAMVMLKGNNNIKELSTYFATPQHVFTRLIYMQNFDKKTAPKGSWSLMAEINYRDEKKPNLEELKSKIKENLLELSIVNDIQNFIDIEFVIHPYAYTVFEKNTVEDVTNISENFKSKNIHLLGRYGKWQYISMAQGYTEAQEMAEYFNSN